MTTYQLSSEELDYSFVDSIKNLYQNKDLIIDIYQSEDFNLDANEITNLEIIKRIKDINANRNIITPNLNI